MVTRLTRLHEGGRAHPWAVTDAPPEYIDGQLRAIVGVELAITAIEAKQKLSQNRSELDREGVVAGLRAEPGPGPAAIADRMAAHCPQRALIGTASGQPAQSEEPGSSRSSSSSSLVVARCSGSVPAGGQRSRSRKRSPR